ncbi:MAG: ATP-dependent DNA helicase RecG, partial [Candidatus Omnitrophica bacterium]|nr:ATP-dependent DNA helicase RecG [Candidatus Omnitrophota bacterium]
MNSVSDSLQYLKGVGPKKIKVFKKLGLTCVEDILYYFPRRYEDRSNLVSISKVEIGKVYTVKGKISSNSDRRSWKRRNFSIVEISVTDKNARIFAVWFNRPYLKQYFKTGQDIILYGKVELYKDRLQISNPEFEILDDKDSDSLNTGRVVPIYSVCEGLTQRFMRQFVKSTLDKYISKLLDPLPYDIRKRNNLLNLAQSLINIHFPTEINSNQEAYKRLSFEEFFLFQIPVILRKLNKKQKKGMQHKINGEIFSSLMNDLPFELTNAQKKVLEEIKIDMSLEYPMQRLLQGEVASGKTVIALLSAAIALDGGYQVAFMAPTEILAKQHFENIKNQLTNAGLKIDTVLLTSELNQKGKKDLYKKIHSGKISLVIGTHALLQERLIFKNLGLVIIDEQHRFGVSQRGVLPKKGNNPDTLIMTATPIPRTLSMTIYGDMDISVIDELPKERLPIKTFNYSEDKLDEVYEFVRNILKQKKQVYFVCPVIEESCEEDLRAAQTTAKEFKEKIFKEFNIGLIHGQMDSKDSDK